MAKTLTDEQKKEVENIMDLAFDWLDTWDVLGGGEEKTPPHVRVAARLKLKIAVSKLALKERSQ